MPDRDGSPVLVQCIGNRYRGDDAAGPAVADLLRRLCRDGRTRVQEHGGEGTALMQHWPGTPSVILVDAACSGAAPGTVHQFDARYQEIPKRFCYYSSHRFGVAEAVALARTLGQLPERLRLYAIEGASFDLGDPLSAPVASAVEAVARNIVRSL